jgi:hypothetical protein
MGSDLGCRTHRRIKLDSPVIFPNAVDLHLILRRVVHGLEGFSVLLLQSRLPLHQTLHCGRDVGLLLLSFCARPNLELLLLE